MQKQYKIIQKDMDQDKESKDIQFLKKSMAGAGKIAMNYWHNGVEAEIKTANYDITTIADRKVEEYLTQQIKQYFPNAHILGEETGGEAKQDGFTLDGIDGSSFFARGLKDWAISLSQIKNGEVILGMIYSPANNELYYAKKGHGAFLNDERIHISKEDNFQHSIVNLGQDIVRIYKMYELEQRFIESSRAHYTIGSSALSYGKLAAGNIDVAAHPGQPIWDIAPGIILVKEAGGMFTNWDGEENFIITRERKNYVIASNGHLHKEALQILKN
jgi:myo-inositol-1(or 4)-monophosphatase